MPKTRIPLPARGFTYVIDCNALVYITHIASNAIRDGIVARLETGEIAVPTSVWDDFSSAYDDEATALSPHVARKIRLSNPHTAAASVMATKANGGFRIEPYGNSDWYAGGTATAEACALLTSPDKKRFYEELLEVSVIDITDLN